MIVRMELVGLQCWWGLEWRKLPEEARAHAFCGVFPTSRILHHRQATQLQTASQFYLCGSLKEGTFPYKRVGEEKFSTSPLQSILPSQSAETNKASTVLQERMEQFHLPDGVASTGSYSLCIVPHTQLCLYSVHAESSS